MKKYIKPISQIVEIKNENMLDGSIGVDAGRSITGPQRADDRDSYDDAEDLW